MKNKSLINRFIAQVGRTINKYEANGNNLGHSLSATAVSGLLGTGGAHINVLEEYQGFAWKAINIRAEVLSSQDLFIERLVNKKWQKDEMHEFNAVLEGAVGQPDLSDLMYAYEVNQCLYGESFWYFSKGDKSSKPMGIYTLDPSCVTVMIDSNKRVAGYVYQKDGDRIALDIDEVLHDFIYDPRHPYRGTGPMQSAGWFVRSARYVNTYVNNFLENNAIPAGVVVAKGTVNDDDWKLFKTQWTSQHGGIDNAGKTGFVRGSDLDFVKTGLSLGEVDFEKMKNTSRDDVMVMFGVSKPMMAIFTDINRASAVTARQLFTITLTQPALMKLSRKLSKRVARWYGLSFRIGSSNPVPEDEDAKLATYDKGIGRWFTVNEARAAYGMGAIANGDVIDSALKTVAPVKSIGKVTIRTKSNKHELNYEMKESFRSKTEDIQTKHEQAFIQKSNQVLKDQKAMVLAQLEPRKLLDAHFDAAVEAKNLSDEVLPILIELAAVQGQLAAELVGSAESSFVMTDVMKKYVADSIAKASLAFTEETQAKIAQAITEGLTEGESVAKIGKRINSIYDDVLNTKTPGYRIERLARTEVIKTSNEITEASYKQSGVVSKKELFNNPGACEFCVALSGSIAQLGGTFVSKGSTITGSNGGTRVNDYEDIQHPPIHCNCKCALLPIIDGAD